MTYEFDLRMVDAVEELKMLESESVDLVLSDPPYPVISGGNKTKSRRCGGMLSANDGKIFKHNNIHITDYSDELYRVLKEGTHCYLMTNLLNLFDIRDSMLDSGFSLQNLLVWKKQNVTPNRYYMSNREFTLFFRKGKARTINHAGSKAVHDFVNPTKNKSHPTEKPVDLMQFYVENSSQEGDLVLDPFMGSGASAIACFNSNRRFKGFELDEKYFSRAQERLDEAMGI